MFGGSLAQIQPGAETAAIAGLLAACGWVLIWKCRSVVRGTTLAAVWSWHATILAVIAITECLLALTSSSNAAAESWRFVAAVGAFCPAMMLFGAKRPQDQPWSFVVLSLWIVLALPAARLMFLGRVDESLDLHTAHLLFMALLIVMSLLNGLPTRQWHNAILMAIAQSLLLAGYFGIRMSPSTLGVVGGQAAYVASLAASYWVLRSPHRSGSAMDRLWLDYRDWFGTLWALRVAERTNAVARMYDWNVTLLWGGFECHADANLPDALSESDRQTLRQSLLNLLRRFVSDDWIERRESTVSAENAVSAENTAADRSV